MTQAHAETSAPRLIVVIDHAGARIHSLRDPIRETGAIADLDQALAAI